MLSVQIMRLRVIVVLTISLRDKATEKNKGWKKRMKNANVSRTDIEHLQEAIYMAHCTDESKEDSKELNHCENCNIFNHFAYVISNDDHTLFNKQLNSTLNDSYRVFAFTHFYSINSVRGPPQIS